MSPATLTTSHTSTFVTLAGKDDGGFSSLDGRTGSIAVTGITIKWTSHSWA